MMVVPCLSILPRLVLVYSFFVAKNISVNFCSALECKRKLSCNVSYHAT